MLIKKFIKFHANFTQLDKMHKLRCLFTKKTETLKGCESIKGFLRPLFWKYSRTAVRELSSIVYENT